jgi:excinuclease UvrABC nuclease subunit
MDFTLNIKENIVSVARKIGYVIIDNKENREYNLVRKLQLNNFPRFHAYVKQQGYNFIFSLHLDQKAPIYGAKGVHAHNGEYFGPVIDNEADRIKNFLKSD